MNYEIKIVSFKLENFNSKNILKSQITTPDKTYNIINYLGKGTVGQVYMIECDQNKYVIKISNSNCHKDLINEVKLSYNYFKNNKISHHAYPIAWGKFTNLDAIGVIYPYLGFYNLEKIKKINYIIKFNHNIVIIKQLINQLISLKNINHCDLKPANVVINITNNLIFASIIDFGLIKIKTDNIDLISTNYITTPESLLTLKCFYIQNVNYKDCTMADQIDLTKHDYYGLYTIIINLFSKVSYWEIIYSYLVNIGFDSKYILSYESYYVYVYIAYKFFYDNINDIKSKSLSTLILKLESNYKINLKSKVYLNFDNFYIQYIVPNLDPKLFNFDYISELKDLLISIYHFDPNYRLNLTKLLNHKLLQLY